MRVVALISGGKDSTFNMMQCIAAGHEIVALANLSPHSQTEIDSYMYQSVGYEAINFIAIAMDVPLFRQTTLGFACQREKIYEPSDESDEVEDLYKLLKQIQNEIAIDAVSVGAILSDYQRIRVENVCVRLGLTPLAYLWQRDQKELLNEIIKCEVDAVVIKVAALGLDPKKHLGRTLSSLLPHLHLMHEKYGLNICGEGGEYETLTLDCPLFKSRIIIEESQVILHTDDPIAPVGYLKLNKLALETKLPALDLQARLSGLPLKNSDAYVVDCDDEHLSDPPNGPRESFVSSHPIQHHVVASMSSDGWLWIGGVQGYSKTGAGGAMEDALRQLKSTLTKYNQTAKNIALITLFISNMDQYGELNRVYCDMFNHVNPPSRACVEVPLKENCVIVSALSWRQSLNDCGESLIGRRTMHVQSRSHWAPANIGPYSQAVKIGDFIHLAGQIGLIPGNLEMVKGGIVSQCRLTLRHIGRLLKAVDSNVTMRDVVQGICYVTDISYVEHARKLWEENTNNAIVDYVVVKNLPKNALVEWHVWAHKHNNQFEYEETGKCVDRYSISIYRRWNYENNIAAIVCHVENTTNHVDLTIEIFVEAVKYTIEKLQQGHENDLDIVFNITIFYSVVKMMDCCFGDYLTELSKTMNLVYTFVPVIYLKNEHTYFSISGVRNQ